MNKDIRAHLLDIVACVEFIERHLGEKRNFHDYREDELRKAAIERKIAIIGEALHRCDRLDPELPITNKRNIIGTRNRIVHAYDAVDDAMMWEIIVRHLPKLKDEVTAVLNQLT